ncbi:hypothetical protein TNCV_1474251 [Trichonephila clavipes]|nr:hypothetical protein TNCV_1474251 [Trichonephila clavipes]
MIPAYNKRCAAFPFETGIHFRRKTDFFPEEHTTKSYSGFEPEPTRLQAERIIVLFTLDILYYRDVGDTGTGTLSSKLPHHIKQTSAPLHGEFSVDFGP